MNRRDFVAKLIGASVLTASGAGQIIPRVFIQSRQASEALPWRVVQSQGVRNLWSGRWRTINDQGTGWLYRTVVTRKLQPMTEFFPLDR